MQLMGDDDEGLSVRLHVAHYLEKLVGFLRSQNGGRLVKYQNVSAAIKDLYDLHGLLLRNRHIVNLLIGIYVEAVFFADFSYLFAGVGQVQLALKTQYDVFRCGKHVHQLEVLMYHAYAVVKGIFGRSDRHGLAVNVNLPLIGVVDTGEHIHKGGFSAAILAQKRKYFTLMQFEIDIVVSNYRTKFFSNVLHLNCTCSSQGGHPFFMEGISEILPEF